jgi:hypothetical protein
MTVKISEIVNSLPVPSNEDRYPIVDASANETKFITHGMLNDLYAPRFVTATGANTAFSIPNILSRRVYFDDFGVIGTNGIVDHNLTTANNAAIIYALAQCLSLGYKEIRFTPGKNYGISRRINLTNNPGITVIQEGANLIPNVISGGDPRHDIYYAEGASTTGWQNLSADRLANTFSVTTSSPISGASVGKWLDIKSDRVVGIDADPLITRANPFQTRQLVTRKIVAISGNTYTFDKPLTYDFFTTDNAQAGLATIVENIRLVNPSCGDNNYDDVTGGYNYIRQFARGINFKRCANIKIEYPRFQGNKTRAEISTTGGRTGLLLSSCYNAFVSDIDFRNLLGYGIACSGNTENVIVNNGYCEDVRHATDTTWASSSNTYEGEVNNITFKSIMAYKCTQSGHSTHNTGLNVSFYNCSSYASGTQEGAYGMIIRNDQTFIQGGEHRYNTLDGVSTQDGGKDTIVEGVICKNNNRYGVKNSNTWVEYSNCKILDNGNAGYLSACGIISGGDVERNIYAFQASFVSGFNQPLIINNVYAPASTGRQTIGVLCSANYEVQNLTLNSNKLIGYGDFVISVPTGLNQNIPLSDGNNQTHLSVDGGRLRGEATLSGGVTSAIANTSVRNLAGTSIRGRLLSNIRVKPRLPVNSGAYTVEIIDRVSFIIKSSNPADASTVMWEITGI